MPFVTTMQTSDLTRSVSVTNGGLGPSQCPRAQFQTVLHAPTSLPHRQPVS